MRTEDLKQPALSVAQQLKSNAKEFRLHEKELGELLGDEEVDLSQLKSKLAHAIEQFD